MASGYIIGNTTGGAVLVDRDGKVTQLTSAAGQTVARGMNANALVVGSVANRAFLWTPCDGVSQLDTPEGATSEALDINVAGDVVGVARVTTTEGPRTRAMGNSLAFVWRPTTGLERLDTRGERTSFAYAINDAGDILGLVGGRPVVWVAPGNEAQWPGAKVITRH